MLLFVSVCLFFYLFVESKTLYESCIRLVLFAALLYALASVGTTLASAALATLAGGLSATTAEELCAATTSLGRLFVSIEVFVSIACIVSIACTRCRLIVCLSEGCGTHVYDWKRR
jgi:hypothetical protein